MKNFIHASDFVNSAFRKKVCHFFNPIVDRLIGFRRINKLHDFLSSGKDYNVLEFCAEAMVELKAEYSVDPRIEKILKSEGSLIILANHPYGCIDSLALMHFLEKHLEDEWKIVSNKLLKNIEELRERVILVNPLAQGEEKKANLAGVKGMYKQLKYGKKLIMFPAARVSGWDDEISAVRDLPWTAHPLKLSKQFNAPILLLHINGQNSRKFLDIPPPQIIKRSMRLSKEIFLQKNKKIQISFSSLLQPETLNFFQRYDNATDIIQAYAYTGVERTEPIVNKVPESLAPEQSLQSGVEEPTQDFYTLLSASQSVLSSDGDFVSFFFEGIEESEVLEEIGRLRELTFSQIGAGSGNSVDLSPEDTYYHHIVVVEKSSGKIAGAYRVGMTQQIIKNKGKKALYLDHIFEIKEDFYHQVGNVLELSRSFIPPQYQKNPKILDLLWKSLGAISVKHNITGMYGSVTVSADFTPLSKAILIDTLDRYHSASSELRSQISSKHPFKPETTYHKLVTNAFAPHGINALNPLIEELEAGHRSTPPLIKYYTTLGAKFLSFKVEPTFNNATYCLLYVDLGAIPPRYKKRFLGVS